MRRGPVSFVLRLLFIAGLLAAWEGAVAYFQTPAPYGWPYLPQQAAQPVPAPQHNEEPKMPQKPQGQAGNLPAHQEVQPVGYFAPAPSYWYSR